MYQYLMLVPGRYRLEGRARSDLDAWLGLQWGLYCQERSGRETRQLAHSDRFVGSTRWRDFRQDFAVPADCPVQLLRLELANPKQGAKRRRDRGDKVEGQGLVRRFAGANR